MDQLRNGTGRFKQLFLNNKFVIFLLGLLLIGLNIFVFTKISYIFTPLNVLVRTLVLPVLLAGVVYYLLNPVVDWLERHKVKRIFSILALFIIIIGLITILLVVIIPVISHQITSLVQNIPGYWEQLKRELDLFLQSNFSTNLQQWINFDEMNITKDLSDRATNLVNSAWSSIGSFFGALIEVALAFITLPFILFYLLKDGKKLPGKIASFLPTKLRMPSLQVMREMNEQISSYIRGQIFVSFCIGLLLYMGYLIIGLEYSLVLALIAACTAVIPYLGPAIAITPALIVAAVTSPLMLVKMVVIWTIVQTIEGKFISPQIMGKSLQIHPITIIFILLTAGNLFGVAGVILGIPGYAVLKVIAIHLFQWLEERSVLYSKEEDSEKNDNI